MYTCTFNTTCDKRYKTSGHLKKHINSAHLGIKALKNISCDYDGCDKHFTRKEQMELHYARVHAGVTFLCTVKDCDKTFAYKSSMNLHVKEQHVDERSVSCTWQECDQLFHRAAHMRQHIKDVHEKTRDIQCTEDGCDETFKQHSHMLRHVRDVHQQLMAIECEWPGCDRTFNQHGNMLKHIDILHKRLKPFVCKVEGCDSKFSTQQGLEVHTDGYHTRAGVMKKQKKQDRTNKILRAAFTVDSECHIKYTGSVPRSDKMFARVDFHITEITDVIVIVENDENGHRHYELSCELSRMEQIHESILKASAEKNQNPKPVLFVRYNCDSFKLNGEKFRTLLRDRQAILIGFLNQVKNGTQKFTETLNIVYLNYDMVKGVPKVTLKEDYAPQMRGCVRSVTPAGAAEAYMDDEDSNEDD